MLTEINKPTFVVDKAVCVENISRMAEKARKHNLRFRPHFKTHQSAIIGNWFRDFGVRAITVSSVSMARYFASHGWDDITIAFPVNVRESNEINELAEKITLNVLVENTSALSLFLKSISREVGVYIEVDTGYFRSGVEVNKVNQVDELLAMMKGSPFVSFKGFLSHTGQTYSARNSEEILIRHADALMKLRSMKEHFKVEYPDVEASLGDTPACSISDSFDGVDEIRPGNFVFYDIMQLELGACEKSNIAAKVLCPVVSRHFSRNEFVMYGGAMHLSKEYIINHLNKKSYGAVGACSAETGDLAGENTYVSGLSQEHGIVKSDFNDLKKFKIGGLAEILPVHSCLAADLAGHYLTTNGEVISKMGK